MRALTRAIALTLVATGLAAPPVASAQDDPATYRCRQAAWAAGYSTARFHLVVGTDQDDAFSASRLDSRARDIVCGFDGDDSIANLKGGDVFLAGEGADRVGLLQDAAFVGGPGADRADDQMGLVLRDGRSYVAGPFYGGSGADAVGRLFDGVFHAGDGPDRVDALQYGGSVLPCCARYVGGYGNDTLGVGHAARSGLAGPSFEGGAGDDVVEDNRGAVFDAGAGADRIDVFHEGWFHGRAGEDRAGAMRGGPAEFRGGTGGDAVGVMETDPIEGGTALTFWGEEDDDHVELLRVGTFNGGAGLDAVRVQEGGTFEQD